MGGRKSYPIKNLIGSSQESKKDFQTLKESIDNSKVKDIARDTLKVFSGAEKAINYTAYSTKFAPTIIRNLPSWREEKNDVKLRREISKSWVEIKAKSEITVPKEVDRIIVDNALKIVRGGSRE